MHLHGFYFEVDSVGDGMRDRASRAVAPASCRHAADAGRRHDGDHVDAGTRRQLAVSLPHHAPRLAAQRLSGAGDHADMPTAATHHHSGVDDGSSGMAGMVLGVTVVGPAATGEIGRDRSRRRASSTLTMQRGPGSEPERPLAGFILSEGDAPPASRSSPRPGPRWCCAATSRSKSRWSINLPERPRCTGTASSSTAITTASTAGAERASRSRR